MRLDAVAHALTSSGAGLIALQELDRGLDRTGRVDQPAELARLMGLQVSFWPTVSRGRGLYGIAVAAPGPFESTFQALPRRGERDEPRGAIVARISGVSLVATHLSLDRIARARQTEALAALVAGLDPPVVVAGDLNQGRRSLDPLLAAGLDPGPGRHVTLRSWRRRQIDFVLAGRGLGVVRSWTLEPRVSDHRPLVAELER